jgi:hypothetical protein
MAQDPLAFPFCEKITIEAKFWKNLELLKFLEKKEGTDLLYSALLKVKKEAESLSRQWWLVARQNRRRALLFMPTAAMPYMREGLEWNWILSGSVYMFFLDDFLAKINPEWYLEQQREIIPQRTHNDISPSSQRNEVVKNDDSGTKKT